MTSYIRSLQLLTERTAFIRLLRVHTDNPRMTPRSARRSHQSFHLIISVSFSFVFLPRIFPTECRPAVIYFRQQHGRQLCTDTALVHFLIEAVFFHKLKAVHQICNFLFRIRTGHEMCNRQLAYAYSQSYYSIS